MFNNETLIPLSQAPLPGHVSTHWRLATKGAGGVRLETIVVGRRRFTTREACERFIRKCTAARDGEILIGGTK